MAKMTKEEMQILAMAKENFDEIEDFENDIRRASIEDREFVYNVGEGQWPREYKDERDAEGRPAIVANKIQKFVAVLANQGRENRVSVRIRPVDDNGDLATAQVFEDIIRQIEFASDADRIYADALEHALAGGFGYFRVLNYEPDDAFEQEIKLELFDNPFSVYFDPDRNYCFISDHMSKAEFEMKYPKFSAGVDWSNQNRGEQWEKWWVDDKVRVMEYYWKTRESTEIVKVISLNGEFGIYELTGEVTEEYLAERGYQVIDRKKTKMDKIWWCKMTAGQIIAKKREVPCNVIPIIEVSGQRVNIEGRIYKRSLIRDVKDVQRMYNYFVTTLTETVALQPKSPYIVAAEQIEGVEDEWDDANRNNKPYLRYKNIQGVNAPKREAPPQLSGGLQQIIDIMNGDLKDVTGIYESFLGERSNERSGRAIFARQRQGQIGTFHFHDNLRRAIVDLGKVFISMIPRVYDSERIVRIRKEDGDPEQTHQPINVKTTDENGNAIIAYDLTLGKYDVVADTRLFSTRRQEAQELMLHAMQHAPMIAPVIVKHLFEFMDVPGAEIIVQEIEQLTEQQAALQGGGGPQGGGGIDEGGGFAGAPGGNVTPIPLGQG